MSSGSRSVENPSVTVDNFLDTGRKIPTTVVADRIATSKDAGVRLGSPVMEKITGPGVAPATVNLSRPASRIAHVMSFTTATGVASTGGGKKEHLTETTDYTVTRRDAVTGNAKLKNAVAVDYSAETWIVTYQPDEAEGTIGGQSASIPHLAIS
jgi:hypothetical protein